MTETTNTVGLATELTIAWLANPNTRTGPDAVPAFLQSMHDAVARLNAPSVPLAGAAPLQEYTPAVSVRKSLASPDHIISMIDGKPYKTLRRHLSTNGLTPDAYRERFGLKADYPMVAPNYSESRRQMAKKIGLGRKVAATVADLVDPVTKPVRKSGKAALAAAKKALGSAE